jgi:hypothetical protein
MRVRGSALDREDSIPSARFDPAWWQGHSLLAVAVIIIIVFLSVAPFLAGYLIEPPGLHFTGAPTYAEDVAQHEAWAAQMSAHLFTKTY